MDSGPAPEPPSRRPRYRGTHPRSFGEKYKELDSARFPEASAKAIARGHTPAGTHVPVLLAEIVAALRPGPGDAILDCTLGHGGHAEALAPLVQPGGRLIGLDVDRETLERSRARLLARGIELHAHAMNFAGLGKVLSLEGLDGVDGVLADLGASAMQLDDPARGFSFKHDGPLDMRMDRTRGLTAAEWLCTASEDDIAQALMALGDEPDARRIASAVKAVHARGDSLDSTRELVRIVLRAKGVSPRYRKSSPHDLHPAARTFQSIRIAVNREDESLRQLLRSLPYTMRPGGRAAVITFHAGEERIVEAALREGAASGLYASWEGPIRPGAEEVRSNPRARSARLWRAEK